MTKHSIILGIAISLSGRYALLGRQVLEGLECYVRDVNAAGGIRVNSASARLPVSLVVEDDESDENKVRTLVEKLIQQDHVDVLIGPYGSGLTLAAAEVADGLQYVLWNHSGSSDEIFECNLASVVGILSPASLYLCAILDMLKTVDSSAKRVALFSAKTGFAADMASGALHWIKREGYTLTVHESYRSGIGDFRPLLERIKADPPDLFLSVGRVEDDILLGRQLRALKPRIKAAGLVVAAISRFKAELREQADGFFAPSQWEPQVRYPIDCGPSEEAFVTHYLKSATVPIDYPAAQGYAAGVVAQRCIEEVGSLDQKALRDAASRLRCTTFYGPYAIDAKTGRQTAHPMLVTQWQRGRKEIVWPKDVAEAQPLYPGPLWN
ncbi:MAG TPA: amino acid ABC transporter substrate-binding protein [Methylomirabilota bacterium]|nr:amino acid ABC transporter substrate-binding protein [Methylomirabilota bacterium]